MAIEVDLCFLRACDFRSSREGFSTADNGKSVFEPLLLAIVVVLLWAIVVVLLWAVVVVLLCVLACGLLGLVY